MKEILVFGAGKSATALIDHLLVHAADGGWKVVVADASEEAARNKIGGSVHGRALGFDIHEAGQRAVCIRSATLVISLLPPSLHSLVAHDCLEQGRHLLTASYVDDRMRALADEIKEKGLLFLCEMGLDPGIDHMSAKKMIDGIQARGGSIHSFLSHCGGLVAPESDDNPWHYKISWNPRNVVMAGKAGAIYRQDGQVVQQDYEAMFAQKRYVSTPGGPSWCWYPNRDSLSYVPIYGLDGCATFIRTTLRHPDFITGWKNLIDLGLTSEEAVYETDNKTLAQFFHDSFERSDFSEWRDGRLRQPSNATDDLVLKQLIFLGVNDDQTLIDKGLCSAADVLQLALEKKLALRPEDRDMIVMLHEIGYELDGQKKTMTGMLVLEGENERHTAMAKTVGLPLALAARLILNGTITETGLHIPTLPSIYAPVLTALEEEGIRFREDVR